jgi:hypothetical protein
VTLSKRHPYWASAQAEVVVHRVKGGVHAFAVRSDSRRVPVELRHSTSFALSSGFKEPESGFIKACDERCGVCGLSASLRLIDSSGLQTGAASIDLQRTSAVHCSSRTQMFRKLIGGDGSPWACSLIAARS